MAFGPIVDAGRLRESLGEPGLVVVDTRWRLGEPGAGEHAYAEGHIPGAAFLDVDHDLAAPPGAGGRHPLPEPQAFAAAARRAGVARGARVVAYDDAELGGAARLWWLLRHFGHHDVGVLDGGLAAWVAAGGELERGPAPADRGGDFTGEARNDDAVSAGDLRIGLRAAGPLLDARSPERYRGESEAIDPLAGHIPGARNLPYTALAPGGRYLPVEELRAHLPDEGFVAYCGSGVSACTLLLAAEAAGIGGGRLYPGSWSEWSGHGLPAERGAERPAAHERDFFPL